MIVVFAIVAVGAFILSCLGALTVMFTMDSGPDWVSALGQATWILFTMVWGFALVMVLGLAIASLFT